MRWLSTIAVLLLALAAARSDAEPGFSLGQCTVGAGGYVVGNIEPGDTFDVCLRYDEAFQKAFPCRYLWQVAWDPTRVTPISVSTVQGSVPSGTIAFTQPLPDDDPIPPICTDCSSNLAVIVDDVNYDAEPAFQFPLNNSIWNNDNTAEFRLTFEATGVGGQTTPSYVVGQGALSATWVFSPPDGQFVCQTSAGEIEAPIDNAVFVPEPGGLAMLIPGVFTVLWMRKRRS